jgi:hypothetical protein
MPQLLRRDTIRLLEASVESLHLAILSLGVPQRHAPRNANARYAATVGLIGTSAELAMSACIVQVNGSRSLIQPTENFKTASHVCSDFRRLLRDAPPAIGFLTQGLSGEASHRRTLLKCTEGFKRLATVRAGGLHWGLGPERAVCGVLAQSVACFLTELSRSARIHSYTPVIPQLPEPVSQITGLAEQLAARATKATSVDEQAQHLTNLFLILPDIPDDPPEWLEALGRVAVAPKRRDVLYLLRSCSQAVPGHLRKISDAEDAIPVAVRPNDPTALPISPEHLRTSFSRLSDQLQADIANANGRLSQRMWAPPPADTVKSIFVDGLSDMNLLGPTGTLTAHQAWPFIAASLAVQGTPGPYWFLVRATSDLGQLKALLADAATLGPAFIVSNLPEIIAGIEAIATDTPVPASCEKLQKLVLAKEAAENKQEALQGLVQRGQDAERQPPPELAEDILAASRGEMTVGECLVKLVSLNPTPSGSMARYWSRVLCDAATTREDLVGVGKVLSCDAVGSAHTAARKALRLIDFLENGPPMATGFHSRSSRRNTIRR